MARPLSTSKPVICYYPENSLDGFAAAMGVYAHYRTFLGQSLKEDFTNTPLKLIPCKFGESVANETDYTGAVVFIVDFTFDQSLMQSIAIEACQLHWFDHLDKAKKLLDLADFVEVMARNAVRLEFDADRCGALITWEYLDKSGKQIPPIISYIDDRDSWTFALGDTKLVCDVLESYPMDVNVWSRFINLNAVAQVFAIEGEIVTRIKNKRVLEALANSVDITIDRWHFESFPITNAPRDISTAVLDAGYKSCSMAITYRFEGTDLRVDIRSSSKDIDVGAICSRLGGGGRPARAGFKIGNCSGHPVKVIERLLNRAIDEVEAEQSAKQFASKLRWRLSGVEKFIRNLFK